MPTELRVCRRVGCGREFLTRVRGNKGVYCSQDCYHTATIKKVTRACKNQVCGREFKAGARRNGGKYCSISCYNDCRRIVTLKRCKNQSCGRAFSVPPRSNRVFCSKKCYLTNKIGEEYVRSVTGQGPRVYVVSRDSVTGVKKREHKARLTIEAALGKKLSKGEAQRIRFVDGNPLNCSLGNLVIIPSPHKVVSCLGCGRVKGYFQRSNERTKCHWCARVREGVTREFVSAVKGVLLVKRQLGVGCVQLCRWFGVNGRWIYHVKNGRTFKEIPAMATKDLWKALLEQHDKLAQTSSCLLYDRVTLLRQVYEDKEYRSTMLTERRGQTELLDSRLKDTCANFTELLQILKLFPKRRQWEKGNLNEMRTQMLAMVRQNQQGGDGPKLGRKSLSWKDKYYELVEKYAELEARYRQLEKDHKELRRSLSRNVG